MCIRDSNGPGLVRNEHLAAAVSHISPVVLFGVDDRFEAVHLSDNPHHRKRALFALSPVPEAAIEIGFIGENPDTLTALVERAKKIARQCDMVTDIRSNWGDKVPVWKPMFSQQKGLRLGITRQQAI